MAALLAAAALGCCGTAWARQVRMPLDQYEALRARAQPPEAPILTPAAPFALQSDQIEMTAGAASARVVQTLAVRALGADWLSIPLGDMGALVDADLGGFEGRVADAPGGGMTLEVRGAGLHRLRLESVVPVVRDAAATRATWRVKLRPPQAAVVRGEVTVLPPLAGAVQKVELGDGGVVLRGAGGPGAAAEAGGDGAAAAGGAGTGGWSFAVLPGKDVEMRLLGASQLPERARLPLRWDATAATWVTASRSRLQVRAWIAVRVAQGQLEELRLHLPAAYAVERIGGPVAGWKVQGGDLLVTPLAPVEDALEVTVELTGAAADVFAAPLVVPVGAAHTVLLARATVQGDGLLELADAGGAQAAEAAELAPLAGDLPQPAGGDRIYRVADAAHPPSWHAVWAEATQVLAAQTDQLWVEVAAGEAGRAAYQLWAAVRSRGAAQLAVTLPAGFQLAAASRDGVPLPPGAGAEQTLLVPLRGGDAPQLVHLSGVVPWPRPGAGGGGGGTLQVPLPALSAPAATIQVRLLLPAGRSYTLADATRALAPAAFAPPEPAPPIAAAAGSGGEPPAAALAGQMALRLAAGTAFDGGGRLAVGAGFVEIAAAWSALSGTPAPLVLKVAAQKEKEPWF